MARSSWLDEEATTHRYGFPDGSSWVVQNEYRPIACGGCGQSQYLRLTHIWHYDAAGLCRPEYHINLDEDLAALKRLLVTYIDGIPVREVERNGEWSLLKGDERIADALA